MVKIHLLGKLGKLFGQEWELEVKSPGEALRAIDANTKGALRKYLTGEGGKKYYKVAIQKKDNLINPEDELNNPSGQGDIYFMPTIKGAGGGGNNGGVLQVVLGVVLIVVGYILAATGYGAALAPYLYEAGIGLIIGGIVSFLTPVPNAQQDSGDSRRSSTFQGNATTIGQGGSVGIVYGQALVAPMPVSIDLSNRDQNAVYTSAVSKVYTIPR